MTFWPFNLFILISKGASHFLIYIFVIFIFFQFSSQSRAALEGENASLTETITRLQEDINNSENKRSTLENDMRHLNKEQNDFVKKLSHAEASLELVQKVRLLSNEYLLCRENDL